MGFYLRKKETGLAGGRAVLCWASDLAVLGALSWVGRGFGSGKRAGLGWAWVWLWWGLGGDLNGVIFEKEQKLSQTAKNSAVSTSSDNFAQPEVLGMLFCPALVLRFAFWWRPLPCGTTSIWPRPWKTSCPFLGKSQSAELLLD